MADVRRRSTGEASRRDLVTNLTLRDLRGQYNRSVLGWAWSVLNPLVTIIVYSLVFSIFLRVEPPVGDPSGLNSFGFFLVTGLLPWTLLAVGLQRSAESITGNQGLVTKVYFPRWSLPASIVMSAFITFLIESAVLIIVFTVASDNNVWPWIPVMFVIAAIHLVFVMSLGVLAAVLNVYFRDVTHLITVGLQPWFFLTPIIYPITAIPADRELFGISYRSFIELNPMTHFAAAYRAIFYDLRFPELTSWLAMLASAAVLAAIATQVYRRLEPRIAEEI